MKLLTPRSRFSRPVSLLIASVGLLLVAIVIPSLAAKAAPASPIPASSAQAQLKSQVQTSSGAPTSGHDPAAQAQTSLAAAAKTHDAIGQRVDHPAANIVGAPRHTLPADVLPDAKTGVSIIGCLTDYGTPGVQCVPARAPGNQPVTCAFVHTIFPQGVAITGQDRLGLKTSPGTACGA